MKRLMLRTVLVLLAIGMAGARQGVAAGSIADEVRAHWQSTRETMLTIAGAVPEDKLDYKPVPEVRSFREMLEHMVEDTAVHVGYTAGKSREESAQAVAKYLKAKTKGEFLEGLAASYDFGDRILADLNDHNALDMVSGMRGERMTRISAYLHALHDIEDHYGNLVVYLRLNGITPPSTATRQQQRQQERGQSQEHQPGEQHQH
jgi:uncharacterized damage-inducible protein DinB